MLAFACALSLLTGLLTGLLPAWRSAGTSISGILQGLGRGIAGEHARSRAQATLVVVQVGLAFAVVACAALCAKSFLHLATADRGFDAENVLTLPISLPASQQSDAATLTFFAQLEERLQSIPGVQEVGVANQMPYVSGMSFPPIQVETGAGIEKGIAHTASVTPSYLDTLGIRVVAGRALNDRDRGSSQPVAVVNQSMVRRYWPDGDPIGRRIRIDTGDDEGWHTVVGVVNDVTNWGGAGSYPEFWVPFAQSPEPSAWVTIKSAGDPTQLIPTVRDAVAAINPDLPIWLNLFAEQIRASGGIATPRFAASGLAVLASVALLLALLGVYGVLSFTLAHRTFELGIRIALGAPRRSIVSSVLGRGLGLTAAGLVLGIVIALLGFGGLEGSLYGISASDPRTLAEVALLVLATGIVAGSLPARRALKVDPMEVFRRG